MAHLTLDFETRSRVDLKNCGADIYAADPSTDILCCSFITDTGNKWLWYPYEPVPSDLITALIEADEVYAVNARFDQGIYECIAVPDYGFPALKAEVWVCAAALCRVNALPSSLDKVTRAINSKHKKSNAGAQLIRQLSIPDKKTGEFNTSADLMRRMGRYCMSDSIATVEVLKKLRPMLAEDKRDWQISERINDKGVKIDRRLAELAAEYAVHEKVEIGLKMKEKSNGVLTKPTQTARLLKAMVAVYEDDAEFMAAVSRLDVKTGDTKLSLDKNARAKVLALEGIDPYWRELIDLVDQGGNSSVSKFISMLARADADTDRVHGAFIFAGAGQTQRYSSKGLQMHNMRRDCFNAEEAEKVKASMALGKKLTAPVMDTLAKLLRPCIIPEKGHKFVVGDWSAIEARVLPWLADSEGGEAVLQIFRDGRDIYVETATSMDMDDRQIGKVATLALGFGGAVTAFQAMSKNYGLVIDDSEASTVVINWRAANDWAVKFWAKLERAARNAVNRPDTPYPAGRVTYIYEAGLLGGTLLCKLPNGSIIQYPYAKIEDNSVTCMKASVTPAADSEELWPRMRLYGGFLSENITQATAGALLRELLHDMVVDGFPVVMHVHDEVVLETPDEEIETTLVEIQEYMEAAPIWAEGLPLLAKPEVFLRYGK
jgi:DNA polymerase